MASSVKSFETLQRQVGLIGTVQRGPLETEASEADER